ncbi:hypothetical protein [Neobacillus terrae]|uniref:hypothetical protein n=1 Tax=Neobacillus terrae TaxID=3034837 RepID=UPI0014075E4E|nr:hypothetical protein [Neobacillus terrae]NHM33751.1 hypothetical protein [Neobacillus terrae]
MKKIIQSISYVLLVLLLALACYGFATGMNAEEKTEEVSGVVQGKFENHVVANTLSSYELNTEYWIKLKDGRTLQLPANFYHKVNAGDNVSLFKPKSCPLFLPLKAARN